MDKIIRTPKVFITNEPLMYERGEWVRCIDLSPAREYGPLVHLTTAGRLPDDPTPTVRQISERLNGFTADDYLLLVGDPRTHVWAGAIAAQRTGGCLKLLIWFKQQRRYEVSETNVFAPVLHSIYIMEKLID